MPDAKATAQAATLDTVARDLKRAGSALRTALHSVRQVQFELNGFDEEIEIETIQTAQPQEAQHGTPQEIRR